jgi:hypothetical protein
LQWLETEAKSGTGVFDTLKAITRELLVAFKEGRLKEPPPPTEEEKQESLRSMARHWLENHYQKEFGDDNPQDFEWATVPGVPRYFILVYAPTKKRPYYTYATSGSSTVTQPNTGPQPRIEFLAYSLHFDQQNVQKLAQLGRTMLTDLDGPPWKEYDTVDLTPGNLGRFILAEAPEGRRIRAGRKNQGSSDVPSGCLSYRRRSCLRQ